MTSREEDQEGGGIPRLGVAVAPTHIVGRLAVRTAVQRAVAAVARLAAACVVAALLGLTAGVGVLGLASHQGWHRG